MRRFVLKFRFWDIYILSIFRAQFWIDGMDASGGAFAVPFSMDKRIDLDTIKIRCIEKEPPVLVTNSKGEADASGEVNYEYRKIVSKPMIKRLHDDEVWDEGGGYKIAFDYMNRSIFVLVTNPNPNRNSDNLVFAGFSVIML